MRPTAHRIAPLLFALHESISHLQERAILLLRQLLQLLVPLLKRAPRIFDGRCLALLRLSQRASELVQLIVQPVSVVAPAPAALQLLAKPPQLGAQSVRLVLRVLRTRLRSPQQAVRVLGGLPCLSALGLRGFGPLVRMASLRLQPLDLLLQIALLAFELLDLLLRPTKALGVETTRLWSTSEALQLAAGAIQLGAEVPQLRLAIA